MTNAEQPPTSTGEMSTDARIMYEDYQPSRHILAGSKAGPTPLPRLLVTPLGEACEACGAKTPGISELLMESAGWISNMDGVVVAFYNRMIDIIRDDAERAATEKMLSEQEVAQAGEDAVADLAFLFPADLLTAAAGEETRGAGQRDKLAKALVALASTYDPSDETKMAKLDNVIELNGRWHGAFVRRDGTIRGATWYEYHVAKLALMDVLSTLGDRFTELHAEAWSQAYDYLASGMIQEQFRSGVSAPRFPAPSKA